jgi:hypothetical protein
MNDADAQTRRALGQLLMASALSVGVAISARPVVAATSPDPVAGMSTADKVRAFVKATASLKESRVIWRTRGFILAYLPGKTPFPIMRFKGCEQQWIRPTGDASFLRFGSNINFLCDPDTDQILDTYKNPLTGKTNTVKHYVNRIKEGQTISEQGVILNVIDQAYPRFYADKRFEMDIAVVEDVMAFRGDTEWPPELRAPPSGSVQSFFASASGVFDTKTTSVPSHFAGHVLMPWYPWVEMKDHPGHMLWHATAYKVSSFDAIPADYMTKATRDYADIFEKSPELDTEPSEFAKRLKALGKLK